MNIQDFESLVRGVASHNLHWFFLHVMWGLPNTTHVLKFTHIHSRELHTHTAMERRIVQEVCSRLSAVLGILNVVNEDGYGVRYDDTIQMDAPFQWRGKTYSFIMTHNPIFNRTSAEYQEDPPPFVRNGTEDTQYRPESLYDTIMEALQSNMFQFLITTNGILKDLTIRQIKGLRLVNHRNEHLPQLLQLLISRSASLGLLQLRMCNPSIQSPIANDDLTEKLLEESCKRNIYQFLLHVLWNLPDEEDVVKHFSSMHFRDYYVARVSESERMAVQEVCSHLSAVWAILNWKWNYSYLKTSEVKDTPFEWGGKKYTFVMTKKKPFKMAPPRWPRHAKDPPSYIATYIESDEQTSLFDTITAARRRDMFQFLQQISNIMKVLTVQQIKAVTVVLDGSFDMIAETRFLDLLQKKSAGLGLLHFRLYELGKRLQAKTRKRRQR